MCFPEILEENIVNTTNFSDLKLASFVKQVKNLSDYFLSKKVKPEYFSSKEFLSAYLLFYFPQNFCKLIKLYGLIEKLISFEEKINLLDFGAGPGSSTLASSYYFKERLKSITYYEIQKKAYSLFLERFKPLLFNNNVKLNLNSSNNKINLFTFSYVLNEVSYGIFKIFKKFERHEDLNPTYIFIEPPFKETLSIYEKIKKHFIKRGFNVIYPCNNIKCPVLKLSKEKESTCFSQFYWKQPEIVKKINSKLHFNLKYLKFSSLILSKKKLKSNFFFPISPSIKKKGKTTVYFCTTDGRLQLELLKRDETENNKLFKNIVRGIPVLIENLNGKRLSKDSKVSFID